MEKFYLFFNPWFSLFKVNYKDTEYGLGWLPLGGYVKISGMIDESMDKEALKKPPQPWEFRSKPAWQRLIIPKLRELFPNCQFFITTHSPQVLSHVSPENIFLLKNENNELSWTEPDESYGMSIDRIIQLIMDEDVRPNDVTRKIENLFEYIERNKLGEAKKLLEELKIDQKTDPEILRAEMLIRQKEF